MGGEKSSRSFVKIAFEAGMFTTRPARWLGGMAMRRAGEVYAGRPAGDTPHITERLESEMPVNEAKVGKQFVEIGEMIDPDRAESSPEYRELRGRKRGYLAYGHRKIVGALRLADSDERYDHDQAQQVIDIAKEVGTDPTRIDELSEIEQQQVKRIIEP
jgi:hypothetical protein